MSQSVQYVVNEVSLKIVMDQMSQNMSIIYHYIGSVIENICSVTPENSAIGRFIIKRLRNFNTNFFYNEI